MPFASSHAHFPYLSFGVILVIPHSEFRNPHSPHDAPRRRSLLLKAESRSSSETFSALRQVFLTIRGPFVMIEKIFPSLKTLSLDFGIRAFLPRSGEKECGVIS
jgi:hypothetical protein